MNGGQSTVLVLLIVLLALEALVHPAVKQFIQGLSHPQPKKGN